MRFRGPTLLNGSRGRHCRRRRAVHRPTLQSRIRKRRRPKIVKYWPPRLFLVDHIESAFLDEQIDDLAIAKQRRERHEDHAAGSIRPRQRLIPGVELLRYSLTFRNFRTCAGCRDRFDSRQRAVYIRHERLLSILTRCRQPKLLGCPSLWSAGSIARVSKVRRSCRRIHARRPRPPARRARRANRAGIS
jgi:hypothetical protein